MSLPEELWVRANRHEGRCATRTQAGDAIEHELLYAELRAYGGFPLAEFFDCYDILPFNTGRGLPWPMRPNAAAMFRISRALLAGFALLIVVLVVPVVWAVAAGPLAAAGTYAVVTLVTKAFPPADLPRRRRLALEYRQLVTSEEKYAQRMALRDRDERRTRNDHAGDR